MGKAMECLINNRGLGNIVQGSILDCSKKYLEKKLKEYDPQLYLKWNPMKTILDSGKTYFLPPEGEHWRGFGMGCWELRRRPNEKTAVPTWEVGNSVVFSLEYLELDVVNHIKDFRFLSHEILKWVQDNDGWKNQNHYSTWAKELEYLEDKSYDKALDESQADLRYAIKHERRAMRDFQDEIKSGKNPLEFLGGAWSNKQ